MKVCSKMTKYPITYTARTTCHWTMKAHTAHQPTKQPCLLVSVLSQTNQLLLTLHIQSEVACSTPCLIVAHHLVHSTVTPGGSGSTVTPGGVGDGDGVDRGGYPTTTGDDLAISGPGEVGGSWVGSELKGIGEVASFQHSGGLVWDEAVCWWVYMTENAHWQVNQIGTARSADQRTYISLKGKLVVHSPVQLRSLHPSVQST